MDSFLTTIVVIIVAAIITWFKKLGKTEDGDDGMPARRPGSPSTGQNRPIARRPQSSASGWEEELRRLLEGEPPVKPPPVRRPPPVVISQNRPLMPPQAPPSLIRPANVPPPRPVMIPAVPRPNPVKVETRQLAALKESSQAYARASSLDVTVAQHIQSVPGQHVGLTSVVRQQASTESNQALALFKNAQTARLAIIASVVLGPPKSLQG